MLENRNEVKMACEPMAKEDRKLTFVSELFDRMFEFNFEEQNFILKEVYGRVKQNRESRLKDLNQELETIHKAINDLG